MVSQDEVREVITPEFNERACESTVAQCFGETDLVVFPSRAGPSQSSLKVNTAPQLSTKEPVMQESHAPSTQLSHPMPSGFISFPASKDKALIKLRFSNLYP